jgi:hypothetical protein
MPRPKPSDNRDTLILSRRSNVLAGPDVTMRRRTISDAEFTFE